MISWLPNAAGPRAALNVEGVFVWRCSAAFGRSRSVRAGWPAGRSFDLLRASDHLDDPDRRDGSPHTFRRDVQRSLGHRDAHPAMAGALFAGLESPVFGTISVSGEHLREV